MLEQSQPTVHVQAFGATLLRPALNTVCAVQCRSSASSARTMLSAS